MKGSWASLSDGSGVGALCSVGFAKKAKKESLTPSELILFSATRSPLEIEKRDEVVYKFASFYYYHAYKHSYRFVDV